MVSLSTLPNELLLKITQHLEGKDLANVRLLHSRFAGLVLTRLVQESSIMVRESDTNKFSEFMLGIPVGMNCSLISRLTQLNLKIYLSSNNLGAFVEVFSQAERLSSLKIWLERGSQLLGVHLDLDIFPANLTTLRIESEFHRLSSIHHGAGNLNRLDKLWLEFDICQTDCAFLQNLPNLSALALLHIEIPRNEWNRFIPAMRNLKTLIISLSNYSYQMFERLCEEIGKNCHSLTDLRLPSFVFHQCVAKLCANYHEGAGVAKTFRRSITHLTIRNWLEADPQFDITSASIPHFKMLPNLIQLRFVTNYGGSHFPEFAKEFPRQFKECSLDNTDTFRKF